MNLSAPFINRPVATTLLAIAVLLAGALAYRLLPVAPLPQVDYPVIEVSAGLPGASPETMASSVATPLERALASTPGLLYMFSSSSQNSTGIELIFDLDRNIHDAARDVQAAINAARSLLPTGMPGMPTYRKANPSQAPIMALALTSATLPPGEVYDHAASVLAQRISQIRGVGEVQLNGSSLPAVRVQVNPNALNHHGIALDDVANALRDAGALRPQGALEHGNRHWQIQTSDPLRRASDYAGLIVAWRNGAAVRLADVADVNDGVEDRYSAGFHNGRDAVLVVISRQPGANIIETVDAIHAQLPMLRTLLPESIDMAIALDRSPGIRNTLAEARKTLVISFVLVIFVVLVCLGRLRSAAVPAIAVPVAVVGACAAMYLFGFSLNNLSLMALIVATGLVVDDAIVVVENVSRHLEEGQSPLQAALNGARELGFTLLAMNLALITVFVSILLMGDIIEKLFREFSITLAAAILISLVVSLTLTPSLCARLLPGRDTTPGRMEHRAHHAFATLNRYYGSSLDWVLQRSGLAMLVLVGLIVATWALYQHVPRGVLPKQDTGQLRGFARGDDGLSFQVMQPKISAYRELLMSDPAIADIAGYIGGGMGINNAFILIRLKPQAERGVSGQAVVDRLRERTPKIPGGMLWLSVDQDLELDVGGGGDGEYEVVMLSDDIVELREWVPKVAAELEARPELVDVEKRGDEGARQVRLTFDTDMARRLGVDVNMIGAVLNNAFSQRQVATLYDRLNQYHVVMELDPRYTQNPEVLEQVYVIGAEGQRIPLSVFSRHSYSIAPDRVNHWGPFAAVGIDFAFAPGVSLSEGSAAVDQALARAMIPSSIQARMEGEGALFKALEDERLWLLIAVVLTVYVLLGVLYESYVHPLVILSTLPSAGVGALLALLLLKVEFNLIAMLGLFLLIGLVMKNAILIVDFALAAERNDGLDARSAVHRAALMRLRPILMTSAAAVLGALPLMLAFGEGSEMRRPLGVTIVGGLIFSQVLTLYITPAVYVALDRLRRRMTTKPAVPHGLRREAGSN